MRLFFLTCVVLFHETRYTFRLIASRSYHIFDRRSHSIIEEELCSEKRRSDERGDITHPIDILCIADNAPNPSDLTMTHVTIGPSNSLNHADDMPESNIDIILSGGLE